MIGSSQMFRFIQKKKFEKLLDIITQMTSFWIIGTTSMDKIFIKLKRLSILGGLFNGGETILMKVHEHGFDYCYCSNHFQFSFHVVWFFHFF
jgi:hypothetical protein